MKYAILILLVGCSTLAGIGQTQRMVTTLQQRLNRRNDRIAAIETQDPNDPRLEQLRIDRNHVAANLAAEQARLDVQQRTLQAQSDLAGQATALVSPAAGGLVPLLATIAASIASVVGRIMFVKKRAAA